MIVETIRCKYPNFFIHQYLKLVLFFKKEKKSKLRTKLLLKCQDYDLCLKKLVQHES